MEQHVLLNSMPTREILLNVSSSGSIGCAGGNGGNGGLFTPDGRERTGAGSDGDDNGSVDDNGGGGEVAGNHFIDKGGGSHGCIADGDGGHAVCSCFLPWSNAGLETASVDLITIHTLRHPKSDPSMQPKKARPQGLLKKV